MGFGVPLGTWFRHELRDYLADLLLSSNARYRTYLSAPYVHALVKRHQAGTTNAGLQLWSLLCFELWLQALPGWTRPNVAPVVGSR
jgi:asparagine synthase (glutamine-hydrolysing)